MIEDRVVVDAVVHGYNWSPENRAIPEAEILSSAAPGFHAFLSPDDASRLTESEYMRNWKADDIDEALFIESPVDIAVYHATPIYDFFKDGHSDVQKGYALRKRSPQRVLVYGAVNPLEGKKALDEMERLTSDHQVDGIKVYAAFYSGKKTHSVSLDDPEFGFPFIEKAIDLGVKVIATHKAIPFGPVHPDPFRIHDIPDAAARYPEMNFEIVHSGFAFLEETAYLSAFGNVWFNLECSGSLAINAPRRFAEFIGRLLLHGGEDRIMHASGCPLVHPRPTIEALLSFQMPEDMVSGLGYPEITEDVKHKILGGNFMRLHGMDEAEVKKKISDDEWTQRRLAEGDQEPWSHLRRRLAAAT